MSARRGSVIRGVAEDVGRWRPTEADLERTAPLRRLGHELSAPIEGGLDEKTASRTS